MNYYLIGIKGSGMSSLAGILQDDGHNVRGCDTDTYVFTQDELNRRNILIDSLNSFSLDDQDFVIVGHNFIDSKYIEQLYSLNIPYMEYHRFLKMYFYGLHQIAVSGTHGKTSTVGLVYQALSSELDISMLRGDGIGVGGKNSHVVYEACEYKDHFLAYSPEDIIITNIDYDHSDYFKSVEDYISSFKRFVDKAKRVFILESDKNKISHPNIITFGLDENADYYYRNLNLTNGIKGEIHYEGECICNINLTNIYGEHNALHVLVCTALAHQNKLDLEKVISRLAKFTYINRRMQIKIINDDVFIDDYAHHPKEIEASISTLRLMYPSKRIVAIFKPDRLSRLKTFKKDFVNALNKADQSYVLPLYELTDDECGSKDLEDKRIVYVDEISVFKNEKPFHRDSIYLFMSSKNLLDLMNSIENIFTSSIDYEN